MRNGKCLDNGGWTLTTCASTTPAVKILATNILNKKEYVHVNAL